MDDYYWEGTETETETVISLKEVNGIVNVTEEEEETKVEKGNEFSTNFKCLEVYTFVGLGS